MQALFIFSLFAFVLTLMSAIVVGGSTSSEMLRLERIRETQRFFEAVATVVKNDITQKYLTALPNGPQSIVNYINGTPELAAMATGMYGQSGMDPWGRTIKGAMFTEDQPLASSADTGTSVLVPVTAIALVSSGPDGILQTTIPGTPANLNQVRSLSVPTDSKGRPTNDDIIYTFDNSEDQMRILQTMQAHMERIGTAALKLYQYEVTNYRDKLIADYEKNINAGKADTPPNMDLSTDTKAPRLISLTTVANRTKLGIDEDIRVLERKLANGKSMTLNAANPTSANAPLLLTITNNGTPWKGTKSGKKSAANFKFVVKVYPDKI